jgi:hypothetical protein
MNRIGYPTTVLVLIPPAAFFEPLAHLVSIFNTEYRFKALYTTTGLIRALEFFRILCLPIDLGNVCYHYVSFVK